MLYLPHHSVFVFVLGYTETSRGTKGVLHTNAFVLRLFMCRATPPNLVMFSLELVVRRGSVCQFTYREHHGSISGLRSAGHLVPTHFSVSPDAPTTGPISAACTIRDQTSTTQSCTFWRDWLTLPSCRPPSSHRRHFPAMLNWLPVKKALTSERYRTRQEQRRQTRRISILEKHTQSLKFQWPLPQISVTGSRGRSQHAINLKCFHVLIGPAKTNGVLQILSIPFPLSSLPSYS